MLTQDWDEIKNLLGVLCRAFIVFLFKTMSVKVMKIKRNVFMLGVCSNKASLKHLS